MVLPDSMVGSPHGQILSQSLEAAAQFLCETGSVHGTTTAVGEVTIVKLTAQTEPTVLEFNTSEDSSPIKVVLPPSLLQDLLQGGNAMMVFTEVTAELTPAFTSQWTTGETVLLQSRAVELSFVNENAGVITLVNVSGSEGILFSFASRLPLRDERLSFLSLSAFGSPTYKPETLNCSCPM